MKKVLRWRNLTRKLSNVPVHASWLACYYGWLVQQPKRKPRRTHPANDPAIDQRSMRQVWCVMWCDVVRSWSTDPEYVPYPVIPNDENVKDEM